MATFAEPPAYKPVGDPVTVIVTGNSALPLEDDDATMPTDCTTPKTGLVEPVGVISASRPDLSCARSVLPTVAFTIQLSVEMTVICALELPEFEDELLDAAAAKADELFEPLPEPPPEPLEPVDPLPPLPPLPPLLPDPLTASPVATLTAATVPAIGEVRLASASDSCALESLLVAEATWACAAAYWAVSELEVADSVAFAASRLACAESTDACRSDGSTVANTCPAVTLLPTCAETDVTVPETANDRSASCAGSIVPLAVTV